MTRGEIGAEQRILFFGRPRLARRGDQIAVAAQVALLRTARCKFGRADAHRDARRTVGAAWTIGDRLAAAEPDPAERVVQLVRIVAAEFGEHLALGLARQIGTRRRAGDKKARKTERCGHAEKTSGLAMRSPPTRVRRATCTNYAARRQWCKVHLPFLNVPF